MTRSGGVLGVVVALGFVLWFARLNGAERITVDLGLWTFYRVPMTWVIFAALLTGMIIMMAASLHADLRVRRFLRDRLEDEDRRERDAADRLQRDLFLPDPDADVRVEPMPDPPPDRGPPAGPARPIAPPETESPP